MIDTHCHLDLLSWSDMEETIKDSSLEYLVTVGYDRVSIEKSLKIANEYEHIYCALGFHPHYADRVSEEDLLWLKDITRNKKVKAIGEIGLDFFKNYSDRKNQEKIFREQINIAKELNLPIVIHSRNAEDKIIEVLKEEKAYEIGGVMHCFSGSYEFMKKCVDLGFYISFSGIITYKNANDLRNVVKKTPITNILLETDSPFLTPQKFRGKPNKPSYIWNIAEAIAELISNYSLEDIDKLTSKNAKLAFNLSTTSEIQSHRPDQN